MGLRVEMGCAPDADTQAILVTRGGLDAVEAEPLRAFLRGGGQVVGEYSNGHALYNLAFDTDLAMARRYGSCKDNVQPQVRHRPGDPFWQANDFEPPEPAATGCGHDLRHLPNLTPLGGWSAETVSLGYRDLGDGRLWLVEADWQDGAPEFSDASADLIASMVGGGFAGRPDRAACADGADNDGDGAVDGEDLHCSGPADDDESGEGVVQPAACGNGQDDDRDGRADWPADPGCAARGDDDEADPDPLPACANGRDDDEDDRVDYPIDPGCLSTGDDDEVEDFAPDCANGADDDEDGATDFPEDRGCRSAADRDEDGDLLRDPACSNGWDDDDDGRVDLADPGCVNAADDDEDDAGLPACDNDRDDDEDGLVDWPDDGCAARGDVCEQAGHDVCDGVCVDLGVDRAHCGRCGHACADDVACEAGSCGPFAFEGIRHDLTDADVGNWALCHQSEYRGEIGLPELLAACDGGHVLLACRHQDAERFAVAAMGEREEVFRDSGDRNNDTHEHNGVAWYFSTNASLGFTAPGTEVRRGTCDTGMERPEKRLCWHTTNNRMRGGWRCGEQTGLNGSGEWIRYIFHRP